MGVETQVGLFCGKGVSFVDETINVFWKTLSLSGLDLISQIEVVDNFF